MKQLQSSAALPAEKKWWQSSNFWNQVITVITAAFLAVGVEFPADAGTEIVGGFFSVFAGSNILYHVAKDWEFRGGILDVFKSSNFWTNLLTLLAGIIPILPIDAIQNVIDAILAGNLQMILFAVFNLANIVYQLFIKKKNNPTTAPG